VLRDEDEGHRASTPLELFFDLTIVVAVGRVAAALHHQLVEGHEAHGVASFAMMMFAVWLAWLNFTWFATAHDADDVPYRLLTFVQLTGVVVFAAGVTRAVVDADFTIVVAGYVVMRVPLVVQWLRVARAIPSMRPRALRYAIGTAVAQLLWIGFLAVPEGARTVAFVSFALVELAVPFVAERAIGAPTFHREHIEERYGLLTIILLGESMVAAAAGFESAFDAGGLTWPLGAVGVSSLVAAFAAWWLYFDHPGHLAPSRTTAFRWGYGHVIVFASLAALGAGMYVAVEAAARHPQGSARTAALAMTLPVAGFLVGLAVLMLLNHVPLRAPRVFSKLAGAAVAVAIGLTATVPWAAIGGAGVMAVLTAWMILAGDQRHATVAA